MESGIDNLPKIIISNNYFNINCIDNIYNVVYVYVDSELFFIVEPNIQIFLVSQLRQTLKIKNITKLKYISLIIVIVVVFVSLGPFWHSFNAHSGGI